MAGVEPAEADDLIEGRGERGQSAAGLACKTAVAIEHVDAQGTGLRVAVEELDTVLQRVFAHERVGVQEQDVLSFRKAYGLVVGPREAYVLLVLQEMDAGEALAQVGDGVVCAGVVHDPDVCLHVADGPEDAVQALLEVVAYVVADDDDG